MPTRWHALPHTTALAGESDPACLLAQTALPHNTGPLLCPQMPAGAHQPLRMIATMDALRSLQESPPPADEQAAAAAAEGASACGCMGHKGEGGLDAELETVPQVQGSARDVMVMQVMRAAQGVVAAVVVYGCSAPRGAMALHGREVIWCCCIVSLAAAALRH